MAIFKPPFPTFADWSDPINDGLVSAWLFNEKSGDTAHDSAGRNVGTLINGPTWVPSRDGGALDLDGTQDDTGDEINMGQPIALDVTGSEPLTLACRCLPDDFTFFSGVCGRYQAGTGDYFIRQQSSAGIFGGEVTGGVAVSTTGVSYGEWHDFVLTFSGKLVSFYVDGVLADSAATTGGVASNDKDFLVGLDPFLERHFDGKIGRIAFWKRCLGPSDVRRLWRDPFTGFRLADMIVPSGGAAPAGGLLKHPGWSGGMTEMTGGMVG